MSSSITESLVHQGKLLAHIAENGHSFELDCDETTTVEAVMKYIESVAGIRLSDQLVLSFEAKLEPQRPLSAYKLPSVDGEIFIFNKVRLQTNSPNPPTEQIDVLEVVDPPLSASMHDPHPLDEAPDPALKALASYERQFRYDYQKGHAVYTRTQTKYEGCEKVVRELKVQEKALEVARDNLNQYYRVLNQHYQDFMKRYTMQHKVHSELLMNFGRDLDKLRTIKLHPSLQTATLKCLADFVKEENLRKVVENCNNSHRILEKKVSDFKQNFGDVKGKVEELFASRSPVPIRNLEAAIKDNQRFINEQKSIMLSLRSVG